MPAPELDYRFQSAQLWRKIGDDEYGKPIVSERECISVRWENKSIIMTDARGVPIRVDAVVHSTCEVPVDSIMWEGKETDLPTDWESTLEIDNLMQVTLYNETPDIKGRAVRRTYGLMRFKDKLPQVQS